MDYYYFYNISRGESNAQEIPGYGNHNCILQLYKLDEDNIKKTFQLVIKLNKWKRDDEISAASANEDNAVMIYHNDELKYFDAMEERESNMPPDDMEAEEPWDVADNDHSYLMVQSEEIDDVDD